MSSGQWLQNLRETSATALAPLPVDRLAVEETSVPLTANTFEHTLALNVAPEGFDPN
jgi:hypothetical protein